MVFEYIYIEYYLIIYLLATIVSSTFRHPWLSQAFVASWMAVSPETTVPWAGFMVGRWLGIAWQDGLPMVN